MKIKILLISIFIAGAVFLLSAQYQARRVKIECPHEAKASTGVTLPTVNIPLEAILEISGNGTSIPSRDIAVQLVPKQANRANSPLLIQLSQIQLSDLSAGSYHFKVTLKRSTDHLPLATLDADSIVQAGSSVNFDQATWNYDLDPDGDGYNSITEIMNGKFELSGGGIVPNVWSSLATNPATGGQDSKPEKPALLRPAAISVMSPGSNGRLKVAGDPFSVQSAVYVNADLLNASGVKKSSAGSYSRMDGSFDLNFDSGAVVGDRVLLYTRTQKDLGDATFDSSRADVGPNSKVELAVKDLQGCQ